MRVYRYGAPTELNTAGNKKRADVKLMKIGITIDGLGIAGGRIDNALPLSGTWARMNVLK